MRRATCEPLKDVIVSDGRFKSLGKKFGGRSHVAPVAAFIVAGFMLGREQRKFM